MLWTPDYGDHRRDLRVVIQTVVIQRGKVSLSDGNSA